MESLLQLQVLVNGLEGGFATTYSVPFIWVLNLWRPDGANRQTVSFRKIKASRQNTEHMNDIMLVLDGCFSFRSETGQKVPTG
jgi:hypothetical protein